MQTNEEKLKLLLDSIDSIQNDGNNVQIVFNKNVNLLSHKGIAIVAKDNILIDGSMTMLNSFSKIRKMIPNTLSLFKITTIINAVQMLKLQKPSKIQLEQLTSKMLTEDVKECEHARME